MKNSKRLNMHALLVKARMPRAWAHVVSALCPGLPEPRASGMRQMSRSGVVGGAIECERGDGARERGRLHRLAQMHVESRGERARPLVVPGTCRDRGRRDAREVSGTHTADGPDQRAAILAGHSDVGEEQID